MKIAVVLSRVPYPLEKGDKLRAYHQLKCLAEKHEVMLCCLSDTKIQPVHEAHLRSIVSELHIFYLKRWLILWRLFIGLFSDKPFQVHYFYQRTVAKKIKRKIEDFHPDHIYCQLIRCSEYVKNLHNFPKTLDYMDALSAGLHRRITSAPFFLRSLLRIEAQRLVAYENLIFDYFERHTIISKQDQQLIYHSRRNTIEVIPNGVDDSYFQPVSSEKKYDLVLTGNMSYPPNIDCAVFLVKEILPLIHRRRQEIQLLIAGANPAKEVVGLKQKNVSVSGWMDDIREAYNSSRIFVAPLRIGSGMQNKLLEAMAMELPCVTSPLAAKALGEGSANFLSITDEPEEFAEKVLHLLNSEKIAAEKGREGKKYVQQNFNWKKTVDQLEVVFFENKKIVPKL
ncbi:MAG: glycosyltransferase [Crocinitomicaceae bacterium]|nr:glycosyltransferase [Crocinitomicaceae bacterium]